MSEGGKNRNKFCRDWFIVTLISVKPREGKKLLCGVWFEGAAAIKVSLINCRFFPLFLRMLFIWWKLSETWEIFYFSHSPSYTTTLPFIWFLFFFVSSSNAFCCWCIRLCWRYSTLFPCCLYTLSRGGDGEHIKKPSLDYQHDLKESERERWEGKRLNRTLGWFPSNSILNLHLHYIYLFMRADFSLYIRCCLSHDIVHWYRHKLTNVKSYSDLFHSDSMFRK